MNVQPFTTGIKKELWEFHKILMWLPIIVGGFIVFLPMLLFWELEDYQWQRILIELREIASINITEYEAEQIRESSFAGIAGLFMPFIAISFLVQLYYFTSCLFDERRDLSVYFWRSLPVSDASSIAIKLLTGGIVIPVIFMLVATITLFVAIIIGLLFSVFLANGYSISLWEVWGNISVVPSLLKIWISLLPYFLWMLPVYAWFMLASMYAKKAPFLWAVMPVALLVVIELSTVAFFNLNSYMLLPILGHYFEVTSILISQHYNTSGDSTLLPFYVLMDKVSITGLLVAAAFLYLTYWLRGNRH